MFKNTLSIGLALVIALSIDPISIASAKTKTIRTHVGKTVKLDVIRGPRCGNDPLQSVTWFKSLLKAQPRHGVLVAGKPYSEYHKRCKKLLMKRKIFYRGTSKGIDKLFVRYPENGLRKFVVKVR